MPQVKIEWPDSKSSSAELSRSTPTFLIELHQPADVFWLTAEQKARGSYRVASDVHHASTADTGHVADVIGSLLK